MGLVWNPFAVPGVVAMLVAWTLGAFVYFTAPSRVANRRLGLLLFLDGCALIGVGAMYMVDAEHQAYALQAINMTAGWATVFLYLGFLAVLDTPLVRWLRPRPVTVGLVVAAFAAIAHRFAYPDLYIADMIPAPYAPWEAVLGPAGLAFAALFIPVLLFALVATADAFRRAPRGSLARARARSYALAFVVRDVSVVAIISIYFLGDRQVDSLLQRAQLVGTSLALLAFYALLAYGILRTQLFDLDLRIKWTVRRGTVAAVFLGVFLVVAQVAGEFLSETYGFLVGGVAAGALVFALAPVQRLAARVADVAMPNVREFSEMTSPERLALYREQARAAWADGMLTSDERRLLDVARARLGIPLDEAGLIEREAMPA